MELPLYITEEEKPTTTTYNSLGARLYRGVKKTIAKRGIRSFVVAMMIPLAFLVPGVAFSWPYKASLPVSESRASLIYWVMMFQFALTAVKLGLSSYLIWDEGGFVEKPIACFFYAVFLVLGLAWSPLVFCLKFYRAGLYIGLAMYVSAAAFQDMIEKLNKTCGFFVMYAVFTAVFVNLINISIVQ